MKVLGIDTSTMTGAIGIVEGEEIISELRVNIAVTHSERLMLHVDGLLKSARLELGDIDALAVGVGPGSFTGLRIGLATVKGLAYATGKPVAGVGTLDVLAENLPYCDRMVCAVLDARKSQVYAALYRTSEGKAETVMAAAVMDPEELAGKIDAPAVFMGEGSRVYEKLLRDKLGDMAVFAPRSLGYPSGAAAAFLGAREIEAGRATDPFAIEPFYIRKFDS